MVRVFNAIRTLEVLSNFSTLTGSQSELLYKIFCATILRVGFSSNVFLNKQLVLEISDSVLQNNEVRCSWGVNY